MTRKKLLVTSVCLVLAMNGCSAAGKEDSTETVAGLTADVLEETTTSASTGEDVQIVLSEELQGISEFTGELDFTYMFDTDAQAEVQETDNIAYTQEGYYSWQDVYGARMLYYCDWESGQSMPVCSKSNCAHQGNGCDAYFERREYPTYGIWYNQESLYVVKQDGDYLCLYQISTDGAVREKSCTLMRQYVEERVYEDGTATTSFHYPEVKIHRGYAYFTDNYPGCDSCSLYRVKLDSAEEAEVLFTLSEHSPCMYNLKPYGRYVLVEMGNFDDSYLNFSGGIYAYDTEEGTVSRMGEEGRGQYCIYDQSLYYCDLQFNIMKKDLKTGQVSLFYENPNGREENSSYDIKLFACEDGLVFSVTNWDTEYCTQAVLDENGTVTSILEGEDAQLHPYTFK